MNKIALATIAKFDSIPKMKAAVKASGSSFFDPFYVNMLHSRIEGPLISGSFFITSEYRDDPTEWKFTARYFTAPSAEGERYEDVMIGEFQQYDSVAEAKVAIWEFQVAQRAIDELEVLLRTVGVDYVSDDSDGKTYLTSETKYLRADLLYKDAAATAAVGIGGEIISLREFSSPRGFANYIKGWVIDRGEFKGADK